MPKVIILKNQTFADVELPSLGENIDASGQIDVTTYTAKDLRQDPILLPAIASGDIVVNDGTIDFDSSIGREYISNDSISDEDGFWYGKRRRFSILWEQPSHDFVAGQVLRLDESTGAATLALADSHANSATTAVVAELVDANKFYAGLTGSIVENIDDLAIDGGLPLMPGTAYFLSSTVPGQLTATVPIGAGEIVKLVGLAIGESSIMIFSYSGYSNETSVTGPEAQILALGSLVRTPNSWQRTVIAYGLNDPSALTPSNGDRYVVGTAGVGDWQAYSNFIAEYVSSSESWYFTPPRLGYIILDLKIRKLFAYNDVDWEIILENQNLFETIFADTGSVVADSLDTSVTIAGGNHISTTTIGNSIVVDMENVSLNDLIDVDTSGELEGSVLKYNAANSLWEISSLHIPKLFYGHNGGVVQDLTDNFSTVNITTNVRSDSIYVVLLNIVAVTESGWYKISYSVGAEASTNARSGSECQLELNGVLVPGSMSWAYHRTGNPGEATATADVLVALTVGDRIRIRVRQRAGLVRTMANGCRLLIEQVEEI